MSTTDEHAAPGPVDDNSAFKAALEDFAKNHPTMDSYALHAFSAGWIALRNRRAAVSGDLQNAAWGMLHAVEAADADGELADNIGGELIDALRAALAAKGE